jgi:hypothetical protein
MIKPDDSAAFCKALISQVFSSAEAGWSGE